MARNCLPHCHQKHSIPHIFKPFPFLSPQHNPNQNIDSMQRQSRITYSVFASDRPRPGFLPFRRPSSAMYRHPSPQPFAPALHVEWPHLLHTLSYFLSHHLAHFPNRDSCRMTPHPPALSMWGTTVISAQVLRMAMPRLAWLITRIPIER